MKMSELPYDKYKAVAEVIDELEKKLQGIVGEKVEVITVMHPAHEKGQCQGVVVSSSLKSETVGSLLYQALMLVSISMQENEKTTTH